MDTTYNGHANYETWHFTLYLDNDEPLYRRKQAWEQNFLNKHLQGRFDVTLAAKAVKLYLLPEVKRAVKRDSDGTDTTDWKLVNFEDVAAGILDDAVENFEYQESA
jgi:hypothetical protein